MNSDILLSLCVPTNGVREWVVPVLDSIFAEKTPIGAFEVIVTDNGNNTEFSAIMETYEKKYDNLVYKHTDAIQFQNQIEAFKLAKGSLIKFINHRMVLHPGALNYFIQYAKDNIEEKPVTYFSNGVLKELSEVAESDSFDDYVKKLSYYSSWSAGTAMWKTDFEKMDPNITFNRYFPHIDMVFYNKSGSNYKIINKALMEEIYIDDTKKGKYDLFDAFAYEYVKVLEELYKEGYITKETFEYVKKENQKFVAELYYIYVFRKKPCSYNLDGFDKAVKHYYNRNSIFMEIPGFIMKGLCKKVARR